MFWTNNNYQVVIWNMETNTLYKHSQNHNNSLLVASLILSDTHKFTSCVQLFLEFNFYFDDGEGRVENGIWMLRNKTNYEENNKNVTTDLQWKVTTKWRSQDLKKIRMNKFLLKNMRLLIYFNEFAI